MSTPSYLHTYLDLSSTHLPEAEFQSLSGCSADLDVELANVVVGGHPHGLWITVPDADDMDAARAGAFPALHAIILHARTLGASWINFDYDAPIIDALAYFEWGNAW